MCLFVVRSSDKRVARDEEFSDSEDEGEGGRKNASTNKEDGPQKKRAKTTTPVPKQPSEDAKVEKKEEENQVPSEPEKRAVESKEDVSEKKEETEAEKVPARFI